MYAISKNIFWIFSSITVSVVGTLGLTFISEFLVSITSVFMFSISRSEVELGSYKCSGKISGLNGRIPLALKPEIAIPTDAVFKYAV